MSVFVRTHKSRFLTNRNILPPIRIIFWCTDATKNAPYSQENVQTIQMHSILSKIGNKLVAHSMPIYPKDCGD